MMLVLRGPLLTLLLLATPALAQDRDTRIAALLEENLLDGKLLFTCWSFIDPATDQSAQSWTSRNESTVAVLMNAGYDPAAIDAYMAAAAIDQLTPDAGALFSDVQDFCLAHQERVFSIRARGYPINLPRDLEEIIAE